MDLFSVNLEVYMHSYVKWFIGSHSDVIAGTYVIDNSS